MPDFHFLTGKAYSRTAPGGRHLCRRNARIGSMLSKKLSDPHPVAMADLPDDLLGLGGVDREIHIGNLRREIDEVAGGEMFHGGKNADMDPKMEEAFLENVLEIEQHGFVCPLDELARDGLIFPPAEELDETTLTAKLWELIGELAKRRLLLHSTNHLSDRELYTWLLEDGLREELMGFGLPMGALPPGCARWVQRRGYPIANAILFRRRGARSLGRRFSRIGHAAKGETAL